MSEPKKGKNRVLSDEAKVKHAIDFIEELSWLLDSKRKLKLSDIPEILRCQLLAANSAANSAAGAANKYASPNPSIHYLIGILPRLFQDKKLFPKNEDIASFASDLLGVDISRVEKRSKYELIGMVVCECNELDDSKLEKIVNQLAVVTENSERITRLAEVRKATGFSWNETIRKLAE